MAARMRPDQVESTREKIKSTQIIKRLTKHALSDVEIMTASQVNAAKILLGKTIPDLKAIEHTGEVAIPVVLEGDAEQL